MRIHSIIHASFENLGTIEEWIRQTAYPLTSTHTYKGGSLPKSNEIDFLIIMGGPQSPLHVDKWPYLQNEINLIKQCIDEDKPLLGICLGAQLISEALGAKTEKSPHREIGLYLSLIHISEPTRPY